MNFCFVLPNLSGGGAERVTLSLAEGLLRRGHGVSLIIFDDTAAFQIPQGLKVEMLLPPGQKISGGFFAKRKLARLLRERYRAMAPAGGFDLTAASLPFADEIVLKAGIDSWHHIHNTLSAEIGALSEHSPMKAFRRQRKYRSFYSGKRVIAVSNGVAADLRDDLGIETACLEVIYNPFDLQSIRKRAAEPAGGIPAKPYIIHAGRFMRQKRHDLLFDAYRKADIPHSLVLLTEPSAALADLIDRKGLAGRVTVAGFQPNPYPWYARAAALVLSSEREGFGNVLVEALACGTPAVSTDCRSGPGEILTGALRAYLSPVGDADALAANLRRAVNEPYPINETDLARFSAEAAVAAIERLARR